MIDVPEIQIRAEIEAQQANQPCCGNCAYYDPEYSKHTCCRNIYVPNISFSKLNKLDPADPQDFYCNHWKKK